VPHRRLLQISLSRLFDARFVYWSSFGCQSIRRSPIVPGGTPVEVLSVVSAISIAANSMHIYFTTPTGQMLSGPL